MAMTWQDLQDRLDAKGVESFDAVGHGPWSARRYCLKHSEDDKEPTMAYIDQSEESLAKEIPAADMVLLANYPHYLEP